jgi:hypothetical protein
MTAVVGLVHDNIIYLGGDRAAADPDTILSAAAPKIGLRDGFIYGYAGTYGIGQLIELIDLLPFEGDSLRYIKMYIVSELKKYIDLYSTDPINNSTTWLIGCHSPEGARLYELSSEDWGVCELTSTAIGTGSTFCLGSLYSTVDKEPLDRVGLALGAAITYSPHCQGPIDILTL